MTTAIKSSLFWTSLEKISIIGIQFVSTVVLSRRLSADDFGLIGVLTVFIAFSNMIADSGMGGALVREKDITKTDLSTLFVFNGFISILAYCILFLIAPLLSRFYEQDIICPLLRVLGLSVIFSALSITQIVQLSRSLNFRAMAICGLFASLLSTIIALFSAYKGLGVWSLVLQVVCQSAFYSLFLFFNSRFVPIIVFNLDSFKKQFRYGVGLLGANCVHVISANINNSIIGKFFTLQLTGFYTQSTRLYNMPNGFLTTVIEKAFFPVMSRETEESDVVAFTLKSIKLSSIIFLPLWAFLSVSAHNIVLLVLGDQWKDAAWIFSVLCIGGIFSMIKSLYRNLFKVAGHTGIIMKLETISVFSTIMLIICLSFLSFEAVVIGVLVSNIFSSWLFVLFTKKLFNVSLYRQVVLILSPSICSIFVYVINYKTMSYFGEMHPIANLVITMILTIIIVFSYYILTNNQDFIKLTKKYYE